MRLLSFALLLGSLPHGGASLSPQPTPRPIMTGVIGVSREEHWGRFQRFVHEYERIYESHNEFVNRWEVFAENSEAIAAHTGSYSMSINKFSDRHPHELTTIIGRYPTGPHYTYNSTSTLWEKLIKQSVMPGIIRLPTHLNRWIGKKWEESLK